MTYRVPLLLLAVVSVATIATPATSAAENAPNNNRSKAEAFAAKGLSCACFEGNELHIDTGKALGDPSCRCPFAERVRKDLASVVAGLAAATDTDRVKIALVLEEKFLPLSTEYERLFNYDPQRYRWFLENVRCTCEGCKATVYFSNCQLACAPAVVYKRRARIFLALGFSTDDLVDYYLAEHNASHSQREQIQREWLLPRRQSKRGWMVPAAVILGAIFVLALFLRGIVRRSNAGSGQSQGRSPPVPGSAEPGAGVRDEELSAADRERVLDALDELDS